MSLEDDEIWQELERSDRVKDVPKWIPLNIRKPDRSMDCYCFNERFCEESFVCYYSKGNNIFNYVCPVDRKMIPIEITHWFPLPDLLDFTWD